MSYLYQISLFVTLAVMPGLDPGIQSRKLQVWMAGSSPAMTVGADGSFSSRFGIMGIYGIVDWHSLQLVSPLPEQTLGIMNFTDQRVTEKFAAFEKEQDPTLVYEALDLIEAAERSVPAGDTAARKQALSRRLRFFAALDRTIDPTWDPENIPVRGVSPPLTHGIVYSSGEVDPATIPDPVVRAEYERALKASKDYERRYHVQFQLRRIDERAMRFVERLLADRYTGSFANRQECKELLAASSVSEARKEQLRALAPRPAHDR